MMKKRHILHWAMGVILTPLLGSCTSDDVVGDAGREGCDIISGQPMTVTSATSATDGSTYSTQFEDGEIVWLWAKKSDGSECITAWQLTSQSGGNLTGSSAKYWPSDGSKLNVYALHGNFKNSTITEGSPSWSNLSLTHTVETNQTSPENKRLSDLLYSHPLSAFAPNSTVQLTFDHLLAKITVKLDLANSKGINEGELANAEVTLTNIQPDATISNESLTGNSEKTNTTGTHTTITAGKITSSITSGDVIGSAIVPLQNFGGRKSDSSPDNVITITLASPDNRSFSYKPETNVVLSAGKEYTYTLKIIGNKITGSLSVSDFISETESIPFTDNFDYLADLKNRNYLGSSSAPHDLSYDYNGQMNTANCYVVTHPGYYKLPLVYGNAIKNGATNAIAYGEGTNSTTFVNHLGNKITNPYIYKNLNNNSVELEANSAELVWQDAPNLITNIELSDDKKFIKFEIKRDNIEQGNAVIAVKDGSDIMWSWHIWVTNKNVYETQAVTASYQGTTQTFMFMPFPLGWNDSTPAPTCTFYQWGRKDPFPPSNGSSFTSTTDKTLYKYDDSGKSSTLNCWYQVSLQADIATSILNPSTFYSGSTNWCSKSSYELWNVGEDNYNVDFETITKSVYDPSPAGFRLPETAAFTGFTSDGTNNSAKNGSWNSKTSGFEFKTGGVTTYWQACGFRHYKSGSLNDVGTDGHFWSAGPCYPTNGRILSFGSSYVYPQSNSSRAHGFSVRPVSE